MGDNLALQAKNHRVDLYLNVPDLFDGDVPNEEAVVYSEEYLMAFSDDLPVGALLARCLACSSTWEPPKTATGNIRRSDWWLCPSLCNLSEKVAAHLLRQMSEGTRAVDTELAEACRSYLLALRRPKRDESWWELVNADPLDWLASEMQRREAWHRRHSEWTDDMNAAYDDFD